MKKALIALTFILLISSSALASTGKTGYMDIQMVFAKTLLGRKYQGIIRGYFDSRQKILDTESEDIRKLREDYHNQKHGKVLDGSALKEKEESLSRKIAEYEKLQTEFSDEVSEKKEELLNDFYQQVRAVVKEIAKREKLSVVLNTTASVSKTEVPPVVYADEDLDITGKIIVEMNKKEQASR